MKFLFTAFVSTMFFGCGGSGSGSGAAAVSGIDMTGTYSLNNVTCTNSSGIIVNVNAPTSVLNDVLTITQNTFSERVTDNVCTSVGTGSINFVSSSSVGFTNMSVSSATGGSCTIHVTTNGPVTPNPLALVYTTGSVPPNIQGTYLYNTTSKVFYLLTNMTDGTPSDKCFFAYNKQ